MLEHEESNIKKTNVMKKFLLSLFFIFIIVTSPIIYLKNPDQDGSLTSPVLAGSLNLAPLSVTPESILIPFSVIA
jgi:hypothetical protein